MLRNLIIGLLAAKGTTLANDASDQQIAEAVQKVALDNSTAVTALSNAKSEHETKITTLTGERDAQKRLADQNATALENEKTGRKADRTVAATQVVDAACKLGIITVADRAAKITALENSTDFSKDAKALIETAPVRMTTLTKVAVTEKNQAALDNEKAVRLEYEEQFAKELPIANQDPIKAHNNVLKKNPTLAEKLRPAKNN